MSFEPWVTAVDVADHLGVSVSWVNKAVQTGSIPVRRAGKSLRFRLSEVDAWMEAGTYGAA